MMTAILFFRADELLIKASHYERKTIAGHVKNGKWVSSYTKNVLVSSDHDDAKVASGQGSFYQKLAHKTLSKEVDNFHQFSNSDKASIILHHATELQSAASASAALSGLKSAMLAGQVPKPAQIKALLSADKETHQKVTSQIKAKIGDAKFDELLSAAVGKVHNHKPVSGNAEVQAQKPAIIAQPATNSVADVPPPAPVFSAGNSWNDVVQGAAHAYLMGNAENLNDFEKEAMASPTGTGQMTLAYIQKLKAMMTGAKQAKPSGSAVLKEIAGKDGTTVILSTSHDGMFAVAMKDDDSGEVVGVTKYPSMDWAESAAANLANGKPSGPDPALAAKDAGGVETLKDWPNSKFALGAGDKWENHSASGVAPVGPELQAALFLKVGKPVPYSVMAGLSEKAKASIVAAAAAEFGKSPMTLQALMMGMNHPDPWHPANLEEGATKTEDGKTYVLRGGRWHLQNKEAGNVAALMADVDQMEKDKELTGLGISADEAVHGYPEVAKYAQAALDKLKGKAAPKVFVTTPPAGALAAKLDTLPWDKLLLADTNSNAKHNNGKINAIKTAAYAGDVAALANMKFGSNTYAKKQALLAQTSIAAIKESSVVTPSPTVAADPSIQADPVPAAKPGKNPYSYILGTQALKDFVSIFKFLGGPIAQGQTIDQMLDPQEIAAYDAASPHEKEAVFDSMVHFGKLTAFMEWLKDHNAKKQPSPPPSPVSPASGSSLTGKPAYDHMAHAEDSGGVHEVMFEKDKWLLANPGQEGELNQALVDLGYPTLQVPNSANPAAAAPPKGLAIPVMSQWFSNKTEGHNKFWSVSVHGKTMKTTYGKIGSNGQETEKVFGSQEAAQEAKDKLITEKVMKGYAEGPPGVHAHQPVAPASAEIINKTKVILPSKAKKAAAIDPVFINKWLGSVPGQAGRYAAIFALANKADGTKFHKWINASKSFYLPPEAKDKYISAAISSLFGVHDLALDSDGNFKSVTFTQLPVTDPVKIQAAAVAWHINGEANASAAKSVVFTVTGPKEGDTKQGADGMLVLKNGRWVKVDKKVPAPTKKLTNEEKAAVVKAAVDAVVIPDYVGLDTAINSKYYGPMSEKIKAAAQLDGLAGLKKFVTFYKNGDVSSKAFGTQFKTGKCSSSNFQKRRVLFHQFCTELKAALESQGKVGAASPAAASAKPKGTPVASPAKAVFVTKDANAAAGDSVLKNGLNAPIEVSAETIISSNLAEISGWKKTGNQEGSNSGGYYTDNNGVQWYCKFPTDPDAAKSELLASKLYAACGVAVPRIKAVMLNGKPGVASMVIAGLKKDKAGLVKAGGAAGFAVDAWLANWDAVGMTFDNLQVHGDGVVHVDVGGSLDYRAQGAKKGAAFGEVVTELSTMRDASKNPQAAHVFGHLTDADIAESAKSIFMLKETAITKLCLAYGPGTTAQKAELASKLIARKNYMAAKYPEAYKPYAPVIKVQIKDAPNFKEWNGPGKGLSSNPLFNDQNQMLANQIHDLAVDGQLEALKDLKVQPINGKGEPAGPLVPIAQHKSTHIPTYHQDTITAMNSPVAVLPDNLVDATVDAGGGGLFGSLLSFFDEIKSLAGSAYKLGRYAIEGKVSGHEAIIDGWKYEAKSIKNGKLNAADHYKKSKENFAKLSGTQQKAVKDYTGSAYQTMNNPMTGVGTHSMTDYAIDGVDKASIPLEEGTVLSRKFSFSDAGDMQKMLQSEGCILKDFGIISTAMTPGVWGGTMHLHITCAEGVRGLFVASNPSGGGGAISSHAGENEIILPYGTKFFVKKVHKKGHSFSDEHGNWGGSGVVIEVVALPN